MSTAIAYIRSNKVRALAVTTTMQSDTLPDLRTVGEFVHGYEASAWLGVGAPKNTPPDMIAQLNRAIHAGLTDPQLKARFANTGHVIVSGSPADFEWLIADETEKWRKVAQFAGITAE